MAKDPVCGMDVDEKTAAGKSEHQGQTYYFCSAGCKASFDKDPQKYVSGTTASAFPAANNHVIGTGAFNSTGAVASFSNRGMQIDVVAPGDSVPTTSLVAGGRLLPHPRAYPIRR